MRHKPPWSKLGQDLIIIYICRIRFDEEILPACLDVGIRDASVAEAAGTYGPTENQTQTRRTGDDLQMVSIYNCSNYFRNKYFLLTINL